MDDAGASRGSEGVAAPGLLNVVAGALLALAVLHASSPASAQTCADGTDHLLALLRGSDSGRVRALAATALGTRSVCPEVDAALADALRDSDADVRAAAAASLVRLRPTVPPAPRSLPLRPGPVPRELTLERSVVVETTPDGVCARATGVLRDSTGAVVATLNLSTSARGHAPITTAAAVTAAEDGILRSARSAVPDAAITLVLPAPAIPPPPSAGPRVWLCDPSEGDC